MRPILEGTTVYPGSSQKVRLMAGPEDNCRGDLPRYPKVSYESRLRTFLSRTLAV